MARLVFFGKLGDAAGGRERDWPIAGTGIRIFEIVSAIREAEPALGVSLEDETVRCIVNEEMASRSVKVFDGDEIAFLPPVSGG